MSTENLTNNVITFSIPCGENVRVEQNFGRRMLDPKHPERSIPPGALVMVRPWSGHFFEWGEIYCLHTADGTEITRLLPGDDDDHFKCVSSNEAEGFLPYKRAKSDILSIERVVGLIHVKPL